MTLDLQSYETPEGHSPFERWLDSFRDAATLARIRLRLQRVALGNLGDHRALGDGLFELRLDFGPGFRIYFTREADRILILYAGGHKGTQHRDIARAKEYHREYKARKADGNPRRG